MRKLTTALAAIAGIVSKYPLPPPFLRCSMKRIKLHKHGLFLVWDDEMDVPEFLGKLCAKVPFMRIACYGGYSNSVSFFERIRQ